ncbi:transcription elongation factor GreA [Flammeovirga yaeyamensis]|uniref:Transcription elongation factor GreA n=1 Tax=Flammeovirga yaeyamensis TaxID=367791 RepID=A0AAX1N202_9BACT|nr:MULTISPECIES: transcription elongation factor GreA [Flammeovirga]ANQ48525.1 transcription elongation factor GreA [Flammeovirga sp. MY04]MBB3696418.1 transcription elongation factor GreA [Flammeovirga yaeyamensis]NMF35097.1 transcription elongation factor GreA [Flammeovirga yaeyamensis]QWG00082.1 transcription elongation factor GreA [Flammeovirga yaeyamensis]
MSKTTFYTQEGLQNLTDELNELKTKGRADIAKQIAEATDKGDLSENAEYDAAKDAQGHLEAKIAELTNLVANARVIDESKLDTSKVGILSNVKIKAPTGAEMTYTLVSAKEANVRENKISVDSPIAQGLMGKKVGEIAEVKTPRGIMKFEILDISL